MYSTRNRAKEMGLNYGAMSAHEASRIWDSYTTTNEAGPHFDL